MRLTQESEAVGIWGVPTSTLDWCELNYDVTFYIAEFWNTVSNTFLMVPAMYGAILAFYDNVEWKYILSHLSLFLVGVGSTLFHMTLKYEMQLCDELPMVYGSCLILYCQVEIVTQGKKDIGCKLMYFLILYCVFVTVIYLSVKNPIFHQTAYGLLAVSIFIINVYIAKVFSSAPRIFVASSVCYMVAFFLWNIDNNFCTELRNTRKTLFSAVAPFTQLHALWHCFVGYSAYLSVIYCCHARLEQIKKPCKLEVGLMGIQVRSHPKSL